MKRLTFLIVLFILSITQLSFTAEAKSLQNRPNILLVVVDDMGYSDVGAFGGEIRTPTGDSLAKAGLRMSSFYVAPSCSPTRSMLMSGTDNHLAGLGNMKEALAENQKGKPGYEGHINNRVVTIASLLRDSGYHTYMTGKWHLGEEIENEAYEKAWHCIRKHTAFTWLTDDSEMELSFSRAKTFYGQKDGASCRHGREHGLSSGTSP